MMKTLFRLIAVIKDDLTMVQIKGRNQFVGKWPADLIEKRQQALVWMGRRYIRHPEYDPTLRGGFKTQIVEGQP